MQVLRSLTLSLLTVLAFALSAFGQTYNVVDLGILPTGTMSSAAGINNLGQVAGFADINNGDRFVGRAFMWKNNGGMKNLGTLPVDPSVEQFFASWASGLNDFGVVVGGSWFDARYNHAIRWTLGGGMQDLGTPPDFVGSTDGAAINRLGQIVGTAYEGAGGGGPPHAFLWTSRGGMQLLGDLPGGQYNLAAGINDLGRVVGVASRDGSFATDHAFRWTKRGGMVDLGIWTPAAINNFGLIAGTGNVGSFQHAFLWKHAPAPQDLGTLPGGTNSSGAAINDLGFVVGWSTTGADPATPHAALWSPSSGMWDLNDLIPPDSGWLLYSATGINLFGQIVGYGTINGETHAFLLTLNLRPRER